MFTNIVESSITIPDLAAVIDSGLYNRVKFDPQTEISKINKEPISLKMATRRRGRVGRTRRGVYVGIKIGEYQNIEPQIKTSDLSASLLSLRNIGIKLEDVEMLPDKPDQEQVMKNLDDLKAIGALNENGKITNKGKEICLYSNEFSPFFASVILNIRDNMTQNNREYYEILSALIILIMTSQQLVMNPNCQNLQRNYDQSSDIITILKTFSELFEDSFQDQKEKCIRFGFEPNAFSRLITSFSNFIHKVFKRKENDRGFLRRHFKEIRKLISTIDLNSFIDYVIQTINTIKPKWISERMFDFNGISGLEKNPSINARHSKSFNYNTIINSRPGWRGLECNEHFYAFSLLVRGRTAFVSIIHTRQDKLAIKIYKCISFKFDDNISIPFFDEVLKCLNYNFINRSDTFLPMHYNPTQDDFNTTLTYQSQWMGFNYMSICVKNDDIDTMKGLIKKVKKMMAFVGNSILIEAPEVD